ncbi:RxLR effector protein, partial [Phytophthora megakarya]
MRFYYVALVVMTTLLATATGITVETKENQVSETTSEIASPVETIDVKRSLRIHEDSEERAGNGVRVRDLFKNMKGKREVLPVNIEGLSKTFQKKSLNVLTRQDRTQKMVANKVGLKNVDATGRNAKWMTNNKNGFRLRKKIKKEPEGRI